MQKRYPDGKYVDVPGLCKVVNCDEIKGNDYSLTPGRYVGVAQHIDDNSDYEERMAEIKEELNDLNKEAAKFVKHVMKTFEELGL